MTQKETIRRTQLILQGWNQKLKGERSSWLSGEISAILQRSNKETGLLSPINISPKFKECLTPLPTCQSYWETDLDWSRC